jgi:hypothetical protein
VIVFTHSIFLPFRLEYYRDDSLYHASQPIELPGEKDAACDWRLR